MLDFGSYNKKMIKKAGIYDPYLDTLGGGERYCLTVAEILTHNGYQVDLFWGGDPQYLSKAAQRFSLDLANINIVPDIFESDANKLDSLEDLENIKNIQTHQHSRKIKLLLEKIKTTRQYDLIFYLSDGSIPFLFSKQNLLHIQVPLIQNQSPTKKIITNLKLRNFSHIICNSEFTRKVAQNSLDHQCQTLYPPVDVNKFQNNTDKDNIILAVGRFDNILNFKKQDVLIEAFKQINQTGWKLVLAGGSMELPDHNHYLRHLQTLADGSNIEFIVNANFETLRDIYSRSKIFWHAAGFGEDENIHPEHTEHFGMTTVEAMASGIVPLVVAKGGLPEIVTDGVNGYLWSTVDELILKTKNLFSNPGLLSELSTAAIAKSQNFTKEKFAANFLKLINK